MTPLVGFFLISALSLDMVEIAVIEGNAARDRGGGQDPLAVKIALAAEG